MEKKVLEILQCTDISKAAGIDKISGSSLKDGANILAKAIAEICNTSIFAGLFPSDGKIAKSKPLYKTVSQTNHENVTPNCLLQLISKVTEKKAYDQVD